MVIPYLSHKFPKSRNVNLRLTLNMNTVNVQVNMETKLVRISTVAEGIALQYSSSVSKGIIEMNSRIGKPMVNVPSVQPKQNWIEKSEAALSTSGDANIGSMSQKEFWKRLKLENDSIVTAGKGWQ